MTANPAADGQGPPDEEDELIRRARGQIEQLLPSAESGGISLPADLSLSDSPAVSSPPTDSFPGYEILREIHRGGQGVVYQAVQKGTKRKVAIKVMKEGPFAGKRDKTRFEREVEVLGQLSHPNIVAIHESGTAAGNFFFVMDYIPGHPLDVYMAGRTAPPRDKGRTGGWSVNDTLRLFVKICEAVNAAHLRGVIHRDLKPGNIRIDTDGVPHILDFGLAKVATGSEASAMTVTGQFVGSLPWASPEQAEGIPSKIDIRTDVYSLGVILYQMLTGRFPYDVVGSMRDVLDRIMKVEPARPSTSHRQINNEVETIVLKCLSKERERRYQTAGELARDIGHYLRGEPIEAKRASTLYVIRKAIRRHRAPVAVAVGFVCLLAIALVVSVGLWQRSVRERDHAVSAEAVAASERDIAQQQRRVAEEQRGIAQAQEVLARRHLYASNMNLAQQAWAESDIGRVLNLLRQHRPAAGEADLRGFEWHYLLALTQCGVLFQHRRPLMSMALSPDGKKLAVGDLLYNGPTVGVLDLSSRRLDCQAVHPGGRFLWGLGFSPDGLRLATCNSGKPVRFWSPQSGEAQAVLDYKGNTYSGIFSSDGRVFLTASEDTTARLWDAKTGKQLVILPHPQDVHHAVFSPDGSLIATACFDGRVRLWDATSYIERASFASKSPQVWWVAFSPDGQLLACAGTQKLAEVWDLRTGVKRATLRGHTGNLFCVAWSPDAKRLATAGSDTTIRLWAEPDWRLTDVLKGHGNFVRGLAFARDGKTLYSAGGDGAVREWRLEGPEPDVLACEAELLSLSFSPDGRTLCAGRADGVVEFLDPDAQTMRRALQAHTGPVRSVKFSPDGRRLATGGDDAKICLWDVPSEKKLVEIAASGPLLALAFSPDGKVLAGASGSIWTMSDWQIDTELKLWEVDAGRELVCLERHAGSILALAFSPDGQVLAAGGGDRRVGYEEWPIWWYHNAVVRLWGVRDQRLLRTLESKPNAGAFFSLCFSRDGRRLLGGAGNDLVTRGCVICWSLPEGRQELRQQGHLGPVLGVRFCPSGQSLVTAGYDQMIRFWDASAGDLRATLKGHTGTISAIDLSPDGMLLASAGEDRTVRYWRAISDAVMATSAPAAPGATRPAAAQPAGTAVGTGVSSWP